MPCVSQMQSELENLTAISYLQMQAKRSTIDITDTYIIRHFPPCKNIKLPCTKTSKFIVLVLNASNLNVGFSQRQISRHNVIWKGSNDLIFLHCGITKFRLWVCIFCLQPQHVRVLFSRFE